MRRIALGLAILAAVCLSSATARAADIYDCYNGSTEQGGNRVTVNGIQTNQYVQQSYPGAQIDVYLKGTTTHATIWQDAAGTVPLANPFTSSGHGVGFWCAADGHYDAKYSGAGITTPFTVSDIHLCFSCGGGGGTVGPGTVNQVSKFTTTTNVGDSSGGPDDGTHVVPWTNGLSIENASLDKSRPNGTNCTTANLLVEYDGSTVGGTASVQTASLSSQKVVGVADQGAGCTGNVRIADHGFHACVFDNQTVIHDAVIASATVAGQCSDGGGSVQGTQVVGRVASVNTGAGTVATVDWFTGDTSLTGGTITSCATGGGSNAYYAGIGQVISCDANIKDDGNGGLTFNNPAYAGFHYWKQGPLPPATPANTRMDTMGTSVTAHTIKHPGTAGAAGQAEVVDTTSTDANGNTIDNMKWGTAGGVEAQVGGVDNANCTAGTCPLINFVAGSNITVTNTSGGNVQISSSGGLSTVTTYIPMDQCTAGQSTNPGNAFWSVAALTNWDAGHWELALNTTADIFCSVRVPHNVAGTPAASWVIDPGSADTTNAHTAALSTCDAITTSLNLQVGALACAGAQNYSSTTTAYSVTELLFAVQATVAADQILVVKIHQASGGSNTQNIVMPPPKLKIDQVL